MTENKEMPHEPKESPPPTEKASEFSRVEKGINVAEVVTLPEGYEPPSGALLGVPITDSAPPPATSPPTDNPAE